MSDDLMRIRGEYVTAKMRLNELADIVSGEATLLAEVVDRLKHFKSSTASSKPILTDYLETALARLRRIHEAHVEAEEVRARIAELRPLAGMP